MGMEDLKQIIGKSEEELYADDLANLAQKNPALAEVMRKHPPTTHGGSKHKKHEFTPQQIADAEKNEAFHRPRQQGEE